MDINSPLYLAGVQAGKEMERRRIQTVILTERARVLEEKARALDAYANCLEELVDLNSLLTDAPTDNVLTMPKRRNVTAYEER